MTIYKNLMSNTIQEFQKSQMATVSLTLEDAHTHTHTHARTHIFRRFLPLSSARKSDPARHRKALN